MKIQLILHMVLGLVMTLMFFASFAFASHTTMKALSSLIVRDAQAFEIGSKTDRQRLDIAIAWVQEHLPYDDPQIKRPTLVVGTPEEVATLYAVTMAAHNPEYRASPNVVEEIAARLGGAYIPDLNVVVMPEREGFDSIVGLGRLVHEAVHWAQFAHGVNKRLECQRKLEEEAYKAQNVFLVVNGAPESALYDEEFIKRKSMCWPEDH